MLTGLLHVCLKSLAQLRHLSLNASLGRLNILKLVLKLNLLAFSGKSLPSVYLIELRSESIDHRINTSQLITGIVTGGLGSNQSVLELLNLSLERRDLIVSFLKLTLSGPSRSSSTCEICLNEFHVRLETGDLSIPLLKTSFNVGCLFQLSFEGSDRSTMHLNLVSKGIGLLKLGVEGNNLGIALFNLSMDGVSLFKLSLKCSNSLIALLNLTLSRLKVIQFCFQGGDLALAILQLRLCGSRSSGRTGKIRSELLKILLKHGNLLLAFLNLCVCCTCRTRRAGQVRLETFHISLQLVDHLGASLGFASR
ncbi:hypothetical protein HG530_009135 [Fusarium avenaceum]|nr:hypothetical protein HG530_009135 [Fusarium avenaceum]